MDEIDRADGGGEEETDQHRPQQQQTGAAGNSSSSNSNGRMFTLKKWNAVAMWSWDVECDTCAICRVQVMDACLRCQSETKVDARGGKDCVVVWGECNHSFHQATRVKNFPNL
jgi:RING-box protein 2